MKSVVINSYGSSDVIRIIEQDDKSCDSDSVKIKVHSCSLNHLDIWVRSGSTPYKHIFPFVLGSDASGEVVEIGDNVTKFNVGDKVLVYPAQSLISEQKKSNNSEHFLESYKILGEHLPGVQSEYIVLSQLNIFRIPDGLSYIDASTIPLVFMTSYEMLVEKGKVEEGCNVLILGANSGVGSASIQIAKFFGAKVSTTVSDKKKYNFAEYLGADKIYYNNKDLYKTISNDIGRNKFDIIIEHIGEKTWQTSTRLLARGGRLIFCGATTGHEVKINLKHMFAKQQSVIGSSMSSYKTFSEMIKIIPKMKFKSINDKTFSFDSAKDAHDYIERRENIGKVTLVP